MWYRVKTKTKLGEGRGGGGGGGRKYSSNRHDRKFFVFFSV